jgi:streptomycin 6-kinase
MLIVPERLAATCHGTPECCTWLELLPQAIRELQDKWSLSLGAPFDGSEVSCAWVAPAVRGDGTRAVLKLGMPHMEAAHELQALNFWDGDPVVRLLEADADLNAMLLEYCEPGTWHRAPRGAMSRNRMSSSPGCSAVSGAGQRHRTHSVRCL